MKKIITAAVLSAVVAFSASPAFASSDHQKISAEIEQQIRTKLTEEGYEVFKIKAEDGMFEAYAKKDGKKLEIYVNEAMEIVKVKQDD